MTLNLNESNAGDRQNGAPPIAAQSPILRGAFVHRMGENPEDERLAARFWKARGFAVENLEDPAERFSRRPDLLLSQDGKPWAYCEVKTVWRHFWKVHILHEDHEEVRTEQSGKSVEERIGGDLVTAGRQLHADNPNHSLPNFVVLVNRDSEASFEILGRIFTTPPPQTKRGLKARRDLMEYEEIQRFRRNVDLCLWANPGANGELLIEGCVLFNPCLRSLAEEIAGLRGSKLIPLEPAA